MTLLISLLCAIYIVGLVVVTTIGSGDPEGRFKFRYAFFWPIYLPRLLRGEEP